MDPAPEIPDGVVPDESVSTGHRTPESESIINPERVKVIDALNDALNLMGKADESGELDEISQRKYDDLTNAKSRTLDVEKVYFLHKPVTSERTGKRYRYRERIPTDGVLSFLDSKIREEASKSEGTRDNELLKQYLSLSETLAKHSKLFVNTQRNDDRLIERIRLEAYLISQSDRDTGDPRQNWLLAEKEINTRSYLYIPKEIKKIESETSAPPEESIPTESTVPISEEEGPDTTKTSETTKDSVEETVEEVATSEETIEDTETSEETEDESTATPSIEEIKNKRFGIFVGSLNAMASKTVENYARDHIRNQEAMVDRDGRQIPLTGSVLRNTFTALRYRLSREGIRRGMWGLLRERHRYLIREDQMNALTRVNFGDGNLLEEAARQNATSQLNEIRNAGKEMIKRADLYTQSGVGIEGEEVSDIIEGPFRDFVINTLYEDNGILARINSGENEEVIQAEIQKRMLEYVESHQDDETVRYFFGNNERRYGDISNFYASDILETARSIREHSETHSIALEGLKDNIDIRLIRAQQEKATEMDYTVTDRLMQLSQRNRLANLIINPTTAAIISTVGLTTTKSQVRRMAMIGAGMAISPWAAPVVGIAVGVSLAIARERQRIKSDVVDVSHSYAVGEVAAEGSGFRKSIEDRIIKPLVVSIDTLRNGDLPGETGDRLTGEGRLSIDSLYDLPITSTLEEGASDEEKLEEHSNINRNIEKITSRYGEILARLNAPVVQPHSSLFAEFDRIQFSGENKPDAGRTLLVESLVKLRQKLLEGLSEEEKLEMIEKLNQKTSEWSTLLLQDKETQEHEFRRLRLRRSLTRGALTGVTLAVGGVVGQEIIGLGARNAPDVLDPIADTTTEIGRKAYDVVPDIVKDKTHNLIDTVGNGIPGEAKDTIRDVSSPAFNAVAAGFDVGTKVGENIYSSLKRPTTLEKGYNAVKNLQGENTPLEATDRGISESKVPDIEKFKELSTQGTGSIELSDRYDLIYDKDQGITIFDTQTKSDVYKFDGATIDYGGKIHITGNIPQEVQDIIHPKIPTGLSDADKAELTKRIFDIEPTGEKQIGTTTFIEKTDFNDPDSFKEIERTVTINGQETVVKIKVPEEAQFRTNTQYPDRFDLYIPKTDTHEEVPLINGGTVDSQGNIQYLSKHDTLFHEFHAGQEIVGEPISQEFATQGPEGAFEKLKTSNSWTHRTNGTATPDGAELYMRTFRDPSNPSVMVIDSSLTPESLDASGMNPIDVQEKIKQQNVGFSFTMYPGTDKEYSVMISDGMDGAWDGKLRLDPNSTLPLTGIDGNQVIGPNGQPMTMGDFSKMVVNQDMLNKISDTGFIETEYDRLHNGGERYKIWNTNLIGMGILTPKPDNTGYNFDSIQNIYGSGEMGNVVIETPQTTITPPSINVGLSEDIKEKVMAPTYEITPPNPITIQVDEPPPIIPIGFAPRETLEKAVPFEILTIYGYGAYSGEGLGWVPRSEYEERRSKRLTENPYAKLDETEEITDYFARMDPEYRSTLEELDRVIDSPMSEHTRAVVTIPAFGEGKIIKKTLEQFLNQVDSSGNPIDPSLFEIIIFENDTVSRPKDETEEEIRQFKADHPEMNVHYAFKRWTPEEIADKVNTVGNGRRYNCDLALLRSSKRTARDGELIIINNDADLEGISPKYISDVVSSFDRNENLDSVIGKRNLPNWALTKPNVRAGQRLWETFDAIMRHTGGHKEEYGGTGMEPSRRRRGWPGMIGENSAMRASIYAAVGGYGAQASLAEDQNLGDMMRVARNYDDDRFQYVNRLQTIKNPRRYLTYMVAGKPLIDMYNDYHENKDIRDLDNTELLRRIPDTFDKARFELDADGIYQKKSDYEHLGGDNFELRFKKLMDMMGVEYVLEQRTDSDGEKRMHVRITNTTRLENGLARPLPSP